MDEPIIVDITRRLATGYFVIKVMPNGKWDLKINRTGILHHKMIIIGMGLKYAIMDMLEKYYLIRKLY